MRARILGVGAAGNKAAINLITRSVVQKEDVILINSTIKDIPREYEDIALIVNGPNGCGQERSLAKSTILQAMESNQVVLDNFLALEHQKVIIITSLCGATGSGMAPIIAKYFSTVINIPTEVIGFVGFEDESPRALRNVFEFCQDLDDSFTVQLIRNSAFLKEALNNRTKAERLANDEVANKIAIMLGNPLVDSEQNIDETDIVKLNNREGYKVVEYMKVEPDTLNSMDEYNIYLKEMLDKTKSIEPEGKKIGLLGVISNLRIDNQEFIDRSYKVIRERIGEPYEVYSQIQDNQGEEFIAFIASGMRMPENKIDQLFGKYNEMNENVEKTADTFYDKMKSLHGSAEDDVFDSFSGGRFKKEINSGQQIQEEKNKFFINYRSE